jgi:hypothetical protein
MALRSIFLEEEIASPAHALSAARLCPMALLDEKKTKPSLTCGSLAEPSLIALTAFATVRD